MVLRVRCTPYEIAAGVVFSSPTFGRAQFPEIVGKGGCSQRFSPKGRLGAPCKIVRLCLVPYLHRLALHQLQRLMAFGPKLL